MTVRDYKLSAVAAVYCNRISIDYCDSGLPPKSGGSVLATSSGSDLSNSVNLATVICILVAESYHNIIRTE